ncbi:MAG: DUF6364 family protein [Parafilimonas sp.]
MAKLTLNIEPGIIKKGKTYAHKKGQSLSSLVENYIKSVAVKEEKTAERKIPDAIRKLSGVIKLPKEYDYKKDIQRHWTKKYS